MASELLNTLRADGEKLLEAELPAAGELVPVVGALVAKLEGKLADLAGVQIPAEKLQGAETPAAVETPPAAGVADESVEALRAKLQAAEAAQAQAGAGAAAPAVTTTEQPAP